VLRTAGNTKRKEPKNDEEMLLMRSLRDMNLSKLVSDDIPLFNSLLTDIFPNQKNVPKMNYPFIENGIKEQVEKKGLIYYEPWILKNIQLYETFSVRHGFMLIGPTGSGKSTCMAALTDCMSEQGTPYKLAKLNPKAITPSQLYGVKSEISDDWTPGVFSSLW